MNNQVTHTGIKTAGIFGMENARTWNPVKGCSNRGCHLHPSHKTRHPIYPGDCWAAQMCNRMAGPWASHEANYIEDNGGIRDNQEWGSKYYSFLNKLKYFHPAWFESQFEKQFPKKRSCILVCYMTDIAYLPAEWVQKIIDKINANNQEREKAGLLLHIFQFLTKDPSVYHKFKWPVNCWLGFTATNQVEFLSRYEEIMDPFGENYSTNQKYAYLEPLREEIKFPRYLYNTTETKWDKLWVIVGGGPEPLHPDWVRGIRDQCQAAVKFYFKSWGKYFGTNSKDKSQWMKTEKWLPNNLLDGRLWEQYPEV